MSQTRRISPQKVQEHRDEDVGTILVCAYDSEAKFNNNHLDGAISLDAFEKQLQNISKDREIVFY